MSPITHVKLKQTDNDKVKSVNTKYKKNKNNVSNFIVINYN